MRLCDIAGVLLFQAALQAQEPAKGPRTEMQRPPHGAGAQQPPVCYSSIAWRQPARDTIDKRRSHPDFPIALGVVQW
jgi:hypothetical protein